MKLLTTIDGYEHFYKVGNEKYRVVDYSQTPAYVLKSSRTFQKAYEIITSLSTKRYSCYIYKITKDGSERVGEFVNLDEAKKFLEQVEVDKR